MKRICCLLIWVLSLLGAQNSKIAYLRLLTPLDSERELYVGQKIELKYSLLLFSGASLMDVEFIADENKKLAEGVELLNPHSSWIKKEDESYENTFVYKIKSANFALPTLKVVAISQDGSYTDSDEVLGKKYEAIVLDGEEYCGVLSDELRVLSAKSKKYDEWNNIVIFELRSKGGNLEDFKLKAIDKQGFNEELIQKNGESSGLYYAVISSHLKEIKFTFFNLQTLRYEEKIVPIVLQDDRVSTQSDLEPKNNFLILSNVVLVALVVLLWVLAFYLRRQKRLSRFLFVLGIVLFGIWLYEIFNTKEVVLKPNAQITILPTKNSTPMQNITFPVRVEVIGRHGEFYKIKFEDSKIGWVRENECQ